MARYAPNEVPTQVKSLISRGSGRGGGERPLPERSAAGELRFGVVPRRRPAEIDETPVSRGICPRSSGSRSPTGSTGTSRRADRDADRRVRPYRVSRDHRNRKPDRGYRPGYAQHHAYLPRCRIKPHQSTSDAGLRVMVADKLAKHRSPAQHQPMTTTAPSMPTGVGTCVPAGALPSDCQNLRYPDAPSNARCDPRSWRRCLPITRPRPMAAAKQLFRAAIHCFSQCNPANCRRRSR